VLAGQRAKKLSSPGTFGVTLARVCFWSQLGVPQATGRGFAGGLRGSGAALGAATSSSVPPAAWWLQQPLVLPALLLGQWDLLRAPNHRHQLGCSWMEKWKKTPCDYWPRALAVFCSPEERSCSQPGVEAKGFGTTRGPEQGFFNTSLQAPTPEASFLADASSGKCGKESRRFSQPLNNKQLQESPGFLQVKFCHRAKRSQCFSSRSWEMSGWRGPTRRIFSSHLDFVPSSVPFLSSPIPAVPLPLLIAAGISQQQNQTSGCKRGIFRGCLRPG